MSGRPLGRLLLGIGGSSAATAADLLIHDALTHAQTITVVATPTAARFLPPLPVPVHTDEHWTADPHHPLHVELLEETDLLLIAPATATTLAKAAHGLADTLLTALVLAHGPGCYFHPSMNTHMWNSPAVRRNIATLQTDGHHILDPTPSPSLTNDAPGSAVGPIPGNLLAVLLAHPALHSRP